MENDGTLDLDSEESSRSPAAMAAFLTSGMPTSIPS